jgi:hypothetical protein
MTKSEDCFAPFDLSKTRKFDRKKDQGSLRKSFYKLGVQYFEVSCFTIKNLNWMPVTLANVAFSCELLLKAILYGFGVDFSKTHGLKGLFEKLPQNEQEYISKNIAIENRETEFYLCLQEQDQAFPEYRYMCEAKTMSANPKFLFAFAHILKFVYESLVRENEKNEELR